MWTNLIARFRHTAESLAMNADRLRRMIAFCYILNTHDFDLTIFIANDDVSILQYDQSSIRGQNSKTSNR